MSISQQLFREKNLSERIENVLASLFISDTTKNFVISIKDFFSKYDGLTIKQLNAFEKVESACNPQSQELMEKWKQTFLSSNEMKINLKILANYYIKTSYFKEYATKILFDNSFVPTKKQYDSMINNKYAQKVIKATFENPKYQERDMVCISKNAPFCYPLQNHMAFIIKTDYECVTSAVKGAKKYLILPFGSDKTLVIEERYLKKIKS